MVLRFSLFITFFLGGCAAPVALQRPVAPVPSEWDGSGRVQQIALVANKSPVAADVKTSIDWREFFPDPQLQRLLELALENNRDIRIAAGRVEEARAQFGLTRAERFPSFSLAGTGSFSGLPTDLSGTGGYATGQRFDISLTSLSFEIDFWGRLANLSEASRQQYLATDSARRAVRLAIIADVAGAYFSRLQSEVQLQDANDLVRSREETMRVVQRGVEIGAAYGIEYEQAASQLESARATLAGAVHLNNLAINRLNFLTGFAASGQPLPPGRTLAEQGLDLSLPGPLESDLLLQRPDVLAAEQRLAASQANVAAARAAFFPRIALTAGIGVASQALAGLLGGGAWNFQPSVSMPIFDFGRRSANLDASKARENIAIAEYEKVIQAAFREVADLLSARQALAIQMRAARANLASQESRQRAVTARYEIGLVGYLEVLEMQRETISVRQNVDQLRRSQLEIATQLYKALGAT